MADLLETERLTTGSRVARSYLRSRRPKLVGINRESSRLANALVGRTIAQDLGISAQRKQLASMFDTWNRARSLKVARTENGTAWSTASHEQSKEDGVKTHIWLTSRDQRVRDSHHIDGQCRKLDALFTLGSGVQTPYPHGSGVSAEDINCRCTTAPQMKACGGSRQWEREAVRAAEWRRQIAAMVPRERALRQWIRAQWRMQRAAFMAALPRG